MTEFQVEGLPCEHGLLWVENVVQFGVLTNENIECFVDTCLTTNQTIWTLEFLTCKKKWQPICYLQYPKPLMKFTKILLLLKEEHHTTKYMK